MSKIGFKVVNNTTKRVLGYVSDPLMNLTQDTKKAYTETVSDKNQLKERVRFFQKNLNIILNGSSVKFTALCENIKNRNYKNHSIGELSVIPVFSSELIKM